MSCDSKVHTITMGMFLPLLASIALVRTMYKCVYIQKRCISFQSYCSVGQPGMLLSPLLHLREFNCCMLATLAATSSSFAGINYSHARGI